MKKLILSAFALWLGIGLSFAQFGENGYNPNSVRGEQRAIYGQPIYEDDIMYRTTVWRKINLLEKQNAPFYAVDNELPKVIIEGVQEGKLEAYYYDEGARSDGVSQTMTAEEFLGKMSYYDEAVQTDVPLRPDQIYIVELKEDLIFDRRRSRMYWDIQTVTLTIPKGTSAANEGYDDRIASFKFKDVYEYMRNTYEESLVNKMSDNAEAGTMENLRAHWINPQNPKRHMCLADAFELRLFSSRIIKISNPQNINVFSMVEQEIGAENPNFMQEILYTSQRIEYDLMEYEHNLWEY